MNIAMVSRLIRKDWYLNRVGILASLFGGVVTLGVVAALPRSPIVLILGVIVVVTILSLNGIGWSIVRLPEIGGTMRSTTVQWSGTTTALLVAELALIASMLLITFFVQAHKRNFI